LLGTAKPIPGSRRLAVDAGVDADQFSARVDEGAAGISRIDGGVGLNEILVLREAHVGAPVALTMPASTVWLN
jgi:hypothetical protein